LKRILSIIILAAFCNSLAACSSTSSWTAVKFKEKASKGRPPPKIVAVIQSSGVEIQFDDNGGEYNSCQDEVAGTDPTGAPIKISAALCKFRLEIPRRRSPLISEKTPESYLKKYIRGSKWKIMSVALKSGGVVEFHDKSGRLNANGTTICGVDRLGKSVEVDLSEAGMIEIKREDNAWNWLVVAGIVGVFAFIQLVEEIEFEPGI